MSTLFFVFQILATTIFLGRNQGLRLGIRIAMSQILVCHEQRESSGVVPNA